jgi:phosphoribosylformimino-5-aminoimidazole carboxamide ribotide isomerase
MIVPCIDLQDGRAVQLVRGRRLALSVDDVLGLLERFQRYPTMHVIDLNAALRHGNNGRWIKVLCAKSKTKVRVGGGIRSAARAETILSWGAEKVIVGSAAFENGRVATKVLETLAARIGKKNLIVAIDTMKGHIVSHGWRTREKLRAEDVIPQLEPYCAEFLATYVDNEGTMQGTSLPWFRKLRSVTRLPITAAGGIRSHREIKALEKIGMNAAVGMAMYKGMIA